MKSPNKDAKVALAKQIAAWISGLVTVSSCKVDDWDEDCTAFTLFAELKMRHKWPQFVAGMHDKNERAQAATRTLRDIGRAIRSACAGTLYMRSRHDPDPLQGYETRCDVTMPRPVYVEDVNQPRKVRAGYESGDIRIELRIYGWDFELEKKANSTA